MVGGGEGGLLFRERKQEADSFVDVPVCMEEKYNISYSKTNSDTSTLAKIPLAGSPSLSASASPLLSRGGRRFR